MKYKLIKRSRGKYWLLRLKHPSPEGWQERSTKQTRRRDAERVAAQIVAGLANVEQPRLTWKALKAKYIADHLPTLKRPGCFKSAAAKFEELAKPHYVDQINSPFMKRAKQLMLADGGIRPTSVASYLKHIRACLGWGEEMGYIERAPLVRAGSTAQMRGRPITLEEFERMLAATPKVVGRARAGQWVRLLNGLWLLGLRIGEALSMTWDGLTTVRPLDDDMRILVYPDSQKNKKSQLVPTTPDGAAFLLATPMDQRNGLVFPVRGVKGATFTADRASKVISKIGARAHVVTTIDPVTLEKRHATAHDLRRSFAQRLVDRGLPQPILQAMMRHADIRTTKAHYAEHTADQLAEDIWRILAP